MTQPLRWGVLSTALINEKVLAGAQLSDDVEVLAIASRDAAKARAAADRWGIERSYGDYDALLADPEVDAVYVPLPNALHHEWTLRALRAGKHVLCEKPYSRRPAEVEEAFALADAQGLVLSEAYMWRYHPQTRRLVEEVRTGTIGELRLVVASFSWPTDVPGDVRLDPALDGGSLMDVGCYCVSAARLLAGEPESVTGQLLAGPSGVDITFAATLSFAGGVLAHIDGGFFLPDRSHLEVVGTEGSLTVSDPWHCRDTGLLLRRQGEEPVPLPTEDASHYRLELEAVGAAVRGEPGAALGRDDALGQARTIDALYRSADEGRTISP